MNFAHGKLNPFFGVAELQKFCFGKVMLLDGDDVRRFCTYGRAGNSYSRGATALIYDYIWCKAVKGGSVETRQHGQPEFNILPPQVGERGEL